MLYVPIVVPEIVLAVAMLIIFITVGVSLGMGTIIIGHCTFCIPYAVITIKGRISGDNETPAGGLHGLGRQPSPDLLAGDDPQHHTGESFRRHFSPSRCPSMTW